MNRLLCAALTLCLAPAVSADELKGPIKSLSALLGTWEVNAEWSGGNTLWSRAVYTPGVGGRTIDARVYVRDNAGATYQRYHTVFAYDAAREAIVAHSFQDDGSYKLQVYAFENDVLSSEWMDGHTLIRDANDLSQAGVLAWTVMTKPPAAADFQTVMQADWFQQETNARPIDTTRFDATGPALRSLVRETTIDAPVAVVYGAWSDGEAFPEAYDPTRPELAAKIDLAIGGRYEWLWDGKLGSNGCQVLSYIPNRMLSFTWNAPPAQPQSRLKRTWVVVEFEAAGARATTIRLTHLGFGQAAHWDETFEYFSGAWTHVLRQFKTNLDGA